MAAEVLQTIAMDPKHLGARIGATLVLHTWGSALTHHPHVHGIVPGGGLAADGKTWVACRPGFFLPVRVLSRLFRRRFLEELQRLHEAGRLQFFGEHAGLVDAGEFKAWLAPLRKVEWVVYAKRPFAGPKAVLAYLSRYTHRVAISNSRLVAMDDQGVCFRWKDYRTKGRTRYKTMTLSPQEFMRRFLLHVLPGGFHRIRHYGLLANGSRRADLARVREHCRSKSSRRPWTPTLRYLPYSRHRSSSAATAVGCCSSCRRSCAARSSGATSIVSASTTNIAVMSTGHVGTSAGDACVSMRPRPSPAHPALAGTDTETGSSADVSATRPANRRDRCSMGRLATRQSP